MQKLTQALELMLNEKLTGMTISGKKKKTDDPEKEVIKIQIRPILLKDHLVFQVAEYTKKQVFHKNLEKTEVILYIEQAMHSYKQLQGNGEDKTLIILSNKHGECTVKLKENATAITNGKTRNKVLTHDREKQSILPKGEPISFLIDLGVITKDGEIKKGMYDKYRQINRFLEYIRDVLPALPKNKKLTILDFGCGKSYLTFAMYYYLKVMHAYDLEIIGLDLKGEVIRKCQELSRRYGYSDLHFLEGDISQYEEKDQVDMVVTLHACDTATDFALEKAVRWNAAVILSVPCCQHEINKQISSDILEPVMKYGLLKERVSALYTDGIRGAVLELLGYDVQILEFIDMEHTPKNILLRCTKTNRIRKKDKTNLMGMMEFFHVQPTIVTLLADLLEIEKDS